jgi:hypothetical protein
VSRQSCSLFLRRRNRRFSRHGLPPRIDAPANQAVIRGSSRRILLSRARVVSGWATERLFEDMATKGQMSGMRGVYLAAAELARQGWIVSPTSRGAAGADILMTTHDCNHAYSVQVKTDTTNRTWFLLGSRAKSIKSDSHIYVLVQIRKKRTSKALIIISYRQKFLPNCASLLTLIGSLMDL